MATGTTTDFSLRAGDVTLRGSVTGATALAPPRSSRSSRSPRPPRLLALHGGGQSSRRGVQYLLDGLANGGVPSASFDFSGHGESSGEVAGSSLRERMAQAASVAAHVAPQEPLSLMATSMGGHIACRLIERLNPPALVLFCPAAYTAQAEDAPFGPVFQGILRATTDYASSPAFTALEQFEGRLLLVHGTDDAVIPAQVLEQYAHRARRAKSVEVVRLAGAGHKLHAWLPAHEEDHRRVLDAVLRTLAPARGTAATPAG